MELVHPDLSIVSLGPDRCIATWRGFLLQVWRTETTLAAARQVRAAARSLAAAHPGPIATLVVVEGTAKVPSAEARAELSAMLVDQASRMACGATAQEAEGFQGAAVRAAMTGLLLVAKSPFPYKIFADVTTAARWMASLPGVVAADAAEVARVVEEMKRRISSAR